MAYGSSRIKGITIEIGGDTRKLDKALGDVNHELSTIQANLRAVESKLKVDPGNIPLLEEKYRLLNEQVGQFTQKSGTLERALGDLDNQLNTGKISTDEYQKSVNNVKLELALTNSELNAAQKALADVSDEMKRAKDAAEGAADGLEDMGDASGKTDGWLGKLFNSANGTGGKFGFLKEAAVGFARNLGGMVLNAIKDGIKWLASLDEATEELREGMAKLDTAFEVAGYSTEDGRDAYQDFYKILGDTDTAVEASQLLAQLTNRQENLASLTKILAGEYGFLAERIPIDALIEAANEAARTGEVTGVLAQAINDAGGDAEELGKKLKESLAGNLTESVKIFSEATGKYEEGELVLDSVADRLKIISDDLSKSFLSLSEEDAKNNELFKETTKAFYDLAKSQEELSRWTDVAAGVYGTFGDSLPIEGLIEAANETARTGKVTGVLADALNWASINEDDFNKKLEEILDPADRANLILDTLTTTYKNASEAFYDNNEALMKNREAAAELDEAMATMGESVSNVKTAFMKAFGPFLTELLEGAAEMMENVAGWLEKIGELLDSLRGDDGAKNIFQTLFGGFLGGGLFGKDSSYKMATAADLPHLAQGTVTRPNSPFLAVVGDNPQEQEIISPLSTIRQAVMEANDQSGGRNMRVTVNFTGTMAQFVRNLHPQITVETDRLGQKFVK